MTGPRVVNPFSLSTGNGPIRNFTPRMEVEVGKGETTPDPSPGKSTPPVQEKPPTSELTQPPPTPGSPTTEAEDKKESSSATDAPSAPSASSTESTTGSNTESGPVETSTIVAPKEVVEPTPVPSESSTSSPMPQPPKLPKTSEK